MATVVPPAVRRPTHHPDEALLFDYATGRTSEAEGLIVATHLTLCPECRHKVAEFEAIGGAIVDDITPVAMADNAFAAVLSEIGSDAAVNRATAIPTAATPVSRDAVPVGGSSMLPRPILTYLDNPRTLTWNSVVRGLEEVSLPIDCATVKLLRIRAGMAMPQHTHGGTEMTMVLAGGFTDETGHYQRGDVAATDAAVDHRPVADAGEDCVCLIVTDAPLRLTGPIGRLLNPFVKF